MAIWMAAGMPTFTIFLSTFQCIFSFFTCTRQQLSDLSSTARTSRAEIPWERMVA